MGDAITSYTPQLSQLALAALNDEDSEVQSNAAYFVGTLVSASSQDLSPQYGQAFGSLQGLFNLKSDRKEAVRARDNACGAIARMILKNKAAVPIEQVSSVPHGSSQSALRLTCPSFRSFHTSLPLCR